MVRLGTLERGVAECAVSLRGWDFPHVSTERSIRSNEYVQQELEWEHYLELWRAYRSGQFVWLSAVPDDWRDQSQLWPPEPGWMPGSTLGVEDTVFQLLEIYEFAARWADNLGWVGSVTIDLSLSGLDNRSLRLEPPRTHFQRRRAAHTSSWSSKQTYPVPTLLADPRTLSIAPALELFELFGWDTTESTILSIQQELFT